MSASRSQGSPDIGAIRRRMGEISIAAGVAAIEPFTRFLQVSKISCQWFC
jgi:hypothetical protein